MIKVFLSDHRHDLSMHENVGEISVKILTDALPEGGSLGDEETSTHCIIHLRPDELANLNETASRRFRKSKMILCVTTRRPGYAAQLRQHQVLMDGEEARFILYARYVDALNDGRTIEAFYKTSVAEAEAIVKGEWKNVPADLRRLFYKAPSTCLSALAILFQGYLAAHAEYRGEKDWNDADLHEALEQMGWNRYRTQAGQSLVLESLGSQKERVRSKEWFLTPFMAPKRSHQDPTFNHLAFRNRVLEEWNDLDGSAPPELLEKLLRDFEKTEPELINSPQFIATAYLEISARLRRK